MKIYEWIVQLYKKQRRGQNYFYTNSVFIVQTVICERLIEIWTFEIGIVDFIMRSNIVFYFPITIPFCQFWGTTS